MKMKCHEYFSSMVFLFLLVAALGFFPESTDAQGRFYFFPSLAIYEEYNENILAREDPVVSDYLTEINPGARLGYSTARSDIELAYDMRGSLYKKNSDLNTTEHRASANWFFHRSRNLEFHVSDAFFYSPNSDFRDPTGIFVERSNALFNSLSSGVTYAFSEKFRVSGNYSLALSRFEEAEFADRTEHTANTRFFYRVSRKDDIFVDYVFQRYDFADLGQIQTHKGGIGLNHQFSQRTSIELYGGTLFIPEGFNNPESSFEFQGGLTLLRRFEGFLFEMNISRDILAVSVRGNGDVTLRQGILLTFTKDFTRKFQGHLRGSFATYTSTGEDLIDTKSAYFEAGSAYQLSRWTSMIFAYNYIYQDSTGDLGVDLGYSQFRVGIMLHRSEGRFSF